MKFYYIFSYGVLLYSNGVPHILLQIVYNLIVYGGIHNLFRNLSNSNTWYTYAYAHMLSPLYIKLVPFSVTVDTLWIRLMSYSDNTKSIFLHKKNKKKKAQMQVSIHIMTYIFGVFVVHIIFTSTHFDKDLVYFCTFDFSFGLIDLFIVLFLIFFPSFFKVYFEFGISSFNSSAIFSLHRLFFVCCSFTFSIWLIALFHCRINSNHKSVWYCS